MGHDSFLSEVCISTTSNSVLVVGIFQWLNSLPEIGRIIDLLLKPTPGRFGCKSVDMVKIRPTTVVDMFTSFL